MSTTITASIAGRELLAELREDVVDTMWTVVLESVRFVWDHPQVVVGVAAVVVALAVLRAVARRRAAGGVS